MKNIIFFISILSCLLITGLTSCDDNVIQNASEHNASSIEIQSYNQVLSFHIYPYIEITNGIGSAYARVYNDYATIPKYMTITLELTLTNADGTFITRTVTARFSPGQNEATSSSYPCGTSFTNVSAKVVSCSPAEIEGYNINRTCYPGEVVIK